MGKKVKPTVKFRNLRVIEWESKVRPRSRPDFNSLDDDTKIQVDTYQILEWLFRQYLLSLGHRIGFEVSRPIIRLSVIKNVPDYVEAIINDIKNQEELRRGRFDAARELFDHFAKDDDPDPSYINRLYEKAGGLGPGAATWSKFLTVERPKKLLRYGFERIYYPSMGDRMLLHRVVKELGGTSVSGISDKQEKALRRKIPGIGRYLKRTEDSGLVLDFTLSPFMKDLIFSSIAVFRPFFYPDDPQDPYTFSIIDFINRKIGYMFRDDRDVNNVEGLLRSKLSLETIRGRQKGNKKLILQHEDRLETTRLIVPEVYAYLRKNKGKLRPQINQYIPLNR